MMSSPRYVSDSEETNATGAVGRHQDDVVRVVVHYHPPFPGR
jgi:hypothetical protein